jgi:hypothetical protein
MKEYDNPLSVVLWFNKECTELLVYFPGTSISAIEIKNYFLLKRKINNWL